MNRFIRFVLRLACRMNGHDERRPTVMERNVRALMDGAPPGATMGHLRICRRCKVRRWVTPKPRNQK